MIKPFRSADYAVNYDVSGIGAAGSETSLSAEQNTLHQNSKKTPRTQNLAPTSKSAQMQKPALKPSSRIVAAGHICLDVTPSFLHERKIDISKLLVPGKLINMGSVNVSTGGPVSNTGIALSILGVDTILMGKIGSDFMGRGVLDLLKQRGIGKGMIVAEDEQTSYTIVIVPKGVDRIFLHNPGANDTFTADDIDFDEVARADIFHFGYPPLMRRMYEDEGEELVRIFKRVKELGITTSLDMSLPDSESLSAQADWMKIIRRVLPYVDLFLPSIEETSFMLKREVFEKLQNSNSGHDLLSSLDINVISPITDMLMSWGAKITAIKCGEKGFSVRTAGKDRLMSIGRAKPADLNNWAGRELHEESFNVPDIASATGSGDSSIAGFLAAYVRGMSLEDTVRYACAVGGENIQAYDALGGIRSWEETVELVSRGWKKNHLKIDGDYWKYQEDCGIWYGRNDSCFTS